MYVLQIYNPNWNLGPRIESNTLTEMLTSALRVLVKNPVKESFDITFMRNEKSCQNINFFSFLIKLSLTGFLTSVLRALVSMTQC